VCVCDSDFEVSRHNAKQDEKSQTRWDDGEQEEIGECRM